MTEQQLQAFLASFDRKTALGRRNYAIAVLMAILGLRASDVAALRLDSLDWRESSIRIARPKSRRVDVLPLPHRVGQAIADYLRHGRPATSARHVFIRHRAPKGTPLTAAAIQRVAIGAYRRCGFDPQWKGTHILRHTVATQMHQHGASLKEVADVLGHRSIETAAVYAKVNLPALASVALPWPEVTT
jgi:integrase